MARTPETPSSSAGISVVAAALYLSLQSPKMTSPRNRLQVFDVLEVMEFLLNSVLFILIGLQLPNIIGGSPTNTRRRRSSCTPRL